MKFKKFFFDTNQVSGMQHSQEQWGITLQKFHEHYPENDAYTCKLHSNEADNFGQYPEHSDSKTLSHFFDENGMEKI
jgi:hypothetical protein